MIAFLQSFEEEEDEVRGDTMDEVDGQRRLSAADDRDTVLELFRFNKDFIRETLLLCVEKGRRLKKFVDLGVHAQVDETDVTFWPQTFGALYEKAVASEDTLALREALTLAHDSYQPALVRKAWLNCSGLVSACLKEHRRMVKMFLSKGYRLRSSHFQNRNEKSFWKDLPLFIIPNLNDDKEKSSDKEDEVKSMHILRAVSKPCYVLTCYSVASDAYRQSNGVCEIASCGCRRQKLKTQMMSLITENEHDCPDSREFRPAADCVRHPECNDPILRCFETSQAAMGFAKKVPECREEYLAMASDANELAVDLLSECVDTVEVDLLLREHTGAEKFFRGVSGRKMTYPRLQMAIQNNHKAFVGHMFCQQVLRDQWHGKVPWQGRSTTFRAVYCLVEAFTLPGWILQYLTRSFIADLGMKRSPNRSFWTGRCNLDEPLNRFIAHTAMYVIFLSLVMLSIFSPVVDSTELRNNFHWYHDVLVTFTLSMALTTGYATASSRSDPSTVQFWRFYDLLMHTVLSAAFFIRLLMGKLHSCVHEICEDDVVQERIPYDMYSNCLFSVAAVLAGTRLLYWFQLHDRVGPIVISLSRVVMDVVTFLVVFVVLGFAFTLALVPLKATNSRCDNYTLNAKEETDDGNFDVCWSQWDNKIFWTIFKNMLELFFWSVLSPEKPEDIFDTSSADGIFAIVIFAGFCFITVIVMLNLLIAVMNTTISKVEHQRYLYWKFVRTCIWVEYFDDDKALPDPFALIDMVRWMIKATIRNLRGHEACTGASKVSAVSL